MTEHYIGDLEKDDEKLVRMGLAIQEDAIVELTVINRMSRQFLAGNISFETREAALDNMVMMSDYEHMAIDEL